jgi:hypothetical protein
MSNFTNLELTDMVLACGTGNRIVILFIVGDTDNNSTGKHFWPNRIIGEEYLRFLSDTLPELLDEVPVNIICKECVTCIMARHHIMLAKLRKAVRGFKTVCC